MLEKAEPIPTSPTLTNPLDSDLDPDRDPNPHTTMRTTTGLLRRRHATRLDPRPTAAVATTGSDVLPMMQPVSEAARQSHVESGSDW